MTFEDWFSPPHGFWGLRSGALTWRSAPSPLSHLDRPVMQVVRFNSCHVLTTSIYHSWTDMKLHPCKPTVTRKKSYVGNSLNTLNLQVEQHSIALFTLIIKGLA